MGVAGVTVSATSSLWSATVARLRSTLPPLHPSTPRQWRSWCCWHLGLVVLTLCAASFLRCGLCVGVIVLCQNSLPPQDAIIDGKGRKSDANNGSSLSRSHPVVRDSISACIVEANEFAQTVILA